MNRRDILKGTLFAPLLGIFGCKSTSTKTNKLYITPVDDNPCVPETSKKSDQLIDWKISGDMDFFYYSGSVSSVSYPIIVAVVLNFKDADGMIEETYQAFNPGIHDKPSHGNVCGKIANWVESVNLQDVKNAIDNAPLKEFTEGSDVPTIKIKKEEFKMCSVSWSGEIA